MTDQILDILNARQMLMGNVRRMMRNNSLHAMRQADLTAKISFGIDVLEREKKREQLASSGRSILDRESSPNEIDTQALEPPLMDLKSAVELFVEEYQTSQEKDYLTLKVDRLRLLDLLVKELRDTTKVAKDAASKEEVESVVGSVIGGRGGGSILGAALKLGGLAVGIGGLGYAGYKAYQSFTSGTKKETTPETTDAAAAPPTPPITPTIQPEEPATEVDKPTASTPSENGIDDNTKTTVPTAPPAVAPTIPTPPVVTPTPPAPQPTATAGATLPPPPTTTDSGVTDNTTSTPVAQPTPPTPTRTDVVNATPPPTPTGVAKPPPPVRLNSATDQGDEDPILRDLRFGILHSSEYGKNAEPGALNFDLSDYIKELMLDIKSVQDMNIITGISKTGKSGGANDNTATGNSRVGAGGAANAGGLFGNAGGRSGITGNDPSMYDGGAVTTTPGTGRTADAEKIAESHLGQDKYDVQGYLNQNNGGVNAATAAWCAAFVNSSLQAAGVKGSGSAIANSFQKWGHEVTADQKVQAGDVLLETRGLSADQAGGHVGFATGKTRIGPSGELQYQMLSGNYGGHVAENWQDASTVMVRRGDQPSDSMIASAQANKPPAAAATGVSEASADPAPAVNRTDQAAQPKTEAQANADDAVTSHKQKATAAAVAVNQSNANSPGIGTVSPRINNGINTASIPSKSGDVDDFPFQLDDTGLMYARI